MPIFAYDPGSTNFGSTANTLKTQVMGPYGGAGQYGGGVGMSWQPLGTQGGTAPAGGNYGGPNVGSQVYGPDGFPQAPGGGGGGTGSTTGSATMSASVPASNIPPPTMREFQYTQNQQNYPWYMRGLGENMAQQTYQTAVNQGARLGASVQGVMNAQNQQNMQRLGYMAQAGQQDLTVGQAMAEEIRRRNDEAIRLYLAQLQGRGQDLSYAAQMASINARGAGGSGGGGGASVGGGSRPTVGGKLTGATPMNPAEIARMQQGGTYEAMGGAIYRGNPTFGGEQIGQRTPLGWPKYG